MNVRRVNITVVTEFAIIQKEATSVLALKGILQLIQANDA